jgi:hypothetical protein
MNYIKAIGGVDFIVFDNIQALLIGDMNKPDAWQATLPLVWELTNHEIRQLWIHHTNDENKSYGDKTRAWQMDTVILLEPLSEDDEMIAFTFKCPKARERTPDNRDDFAQTIIRLVDDEWEFHPVSLRDQNDPPQQAQKFYRALQDAIAENGVDRGGKMMVTFPQWDEEAENQQLIKPTGEDERSNKTRTSTINRNRRQLEEAGWTKKTGVFVAAIHVESRSFRRA